MQETQKTRLKPPQTGDHNIALFKQTRSLLGQVRGSAREKPRFILCHPRKGATTNEHRTRWRKSSLNFDPVEHLTEAYVANFLRAPQFWWQKDIRDTAEHLRRQRSQSRSRGDDQWSSSSSWWGSSDWSENEWQSGGWSPGRYVEIPTEENLAAFAASLESFGFTVTPPAAAVPAPTTPPEPKAAPPHYERYTSAAAGPKETSDNPFWRLTEQPPPAPPSPRELPAFAKDSSKFR